MPTQDSSWTTQILIRKGQVLANFHAQNPTKQIEGPRGTTSASTLTASKAYQGPLATVSTNSPTEYISISDIADLENIDGTDTWVLRANTTILANQILQVPTGFPLSVGAGKTITNFGTILVSGSGTALVNFGTVQNRSRITIELGGACLSNGTITNSGTMLILLGTLNTLGISTNSGTITNTGSITNIGTFTNTGTIYNSEYGFLQNNEGATFDNSEGTIYNSPDGTIMGISGGTIIQQ
jgi:hypothetical protein